MTKTEYAQYIASPEWQEKRKEALAFANNRCSRCSMPRWLAAIAYDQDLHVHHLHYQTVGDEDAFDDLEVLCRRCHEIETFGRSDLREVKSTICETCRERHYDRYSSQCSTCIRMTDPPELYFLLESIDNGTPRAFEVMSTCCSALEAHNVGFDMAIELVSKVYDSAAKRKATQE